MFWTAIRTAALALVLTGIGLSVSGEIVDAGQPGPCVDFVTAGGWFIWRDTSTGAYSRVNVGFNAGFKNANQTQPTAEMNYMDHNAPGMKLKLTSIDTYVNCDNASFNPRPGKPCRLFQGLAEMNGVAGFRYDVRVVDYTEPGRPDWFRIQLFQPGTPYSQNEACNGTYAANSDYRGPCGDVADSQWDGGNIQIHKPCS